MKEQQLDDLSIFALRELARRVGVGSPTSKRKNELIEEIIAIREGRKQPVDLSSRQGRPPKNSVLNLDPVLERDTKIFTFNQNDNSSNLNQQYVSGYVEKLNNNVGFLWYKSHEKYQTYFIPAAAFVGNIKSGDFVTAEMLNSAEASVVKSIIAIDNIPVQNFVNRLNYEDLEHQFATENITFEDDKYSLDAKYGEIAYFYGNNNNNNTQTIISLLNNCSADARIYINLAMVDKNKIYLNNLKNTEVFTCSILDDVDYAKRIIGLVIDRAKRLIEQGKNVVVAIDDMLTLLSIDSSLLKQLLSTTKNSANGSISMFAIMSDNKNLTILEKLADTRFSITKEGVFEI